MSHDGKMIIKYLFLIPGKIIDCSMCMLFIIANKLIVLSILIQVIHVIHIGYILFYVMQVRRSIRNPWAHCDFTEWDAVKYANSFQLMEKLIKDLSLSFTEEHEIIGEMKKWEINGNGKGYTLESF